MSVHLSLTPLYLTPSASVDLGNTLRGQLKFSLRSADKGRGEGERHSGGWGGKRTPYFETSFIVCPPTKKRVTMQASAFETGIPICAGRL